MNLLVLDNLPIWQRIALVLLVAVVAHLAVRIIRFASHRLLSAGTLLRWSKLRTLAGLATSVVVFALYFGAFGLILHEFGVSLTAYLASASIIGLAIGFGSQGVVQDVVTGLTVIMSDLFQVGDMVEISDNIGIVQSIGMRFTVLLSPLGATVYIPNRTLSSVIIYPRGYVRCFADITLAAEPDLQRRMKAGIEEITRGFSEQCPGISRDTPEISTVQSMPSGRSYIRVKFRIWPGRSSPIENTYKSEIVCALGEIDPGYSDWMVSIDNEISETPVTTMPFRLPRGHTRQAL